MHSFENCSQALSCAQWLEHCSVGNIHNSIKPVTQFQITKLMYCTVNICTWDELIIHRIALLSRTATQGIRCTCSCSFVFLKGNIDVYRLKEQSILSHTEKPGPQTPRKLSCSVLRHYSDLWEFERPPSLLCDNVNVYSVPLTVWHASPVVQVCSARSTKCFTVNRYESWERKVINPDLPKITIMTLWLSVPKYVKSERWKRLFNRLSYSSGSIHSHIVSIIISVTHNTG